MKTVACLQETDGLMQRTRLWIEARDGKPYEFELRSPLVQTGTDVVMGWGKLDGEVAVVTFEGVPTFRVPLAKWREIEAWAKVS